MCTSRRHNRIYKTSCDTTRTSTRTLSKKFNRRCDSLGNLEADCIKKLFKPKQNQNINKNL